MNFHGLVANVIAAVNPLTTVTWQQSTGYTIGADGSQIPTYSSSSVQAQIQALSAREIEHLNALNITGVLRAVYMNGDVESLVRTARQGGDLIQFNGQTWLVVQVLEHWPDWSKVAICLQA